MSAPTTTKGITALFHLKKGKPLKLRFAEMRPVTMGSRLPHAFSFSWKCVHDGTYHNPNDNQVYLDGYLRGSRQTGFYQIGDQLIPVAEVKSITLEHFDYEVPLDTTIHQGD